MEGLGAGLSALAFWGFIAAVVVAGIWYGLRERQAQYETLRHLIDSDKPIDDAIVKEVLGGTVRLDRGLKIAAIIALFTAPGLAVLGYFVGKIAEQALTSLLGVAGLTAFVGIGLWVAAKLAERSFLEEGTGSVGRELPR